LSSAKTGEALPPINWTLDLWAIRGILSRVTTDFLRPPASIRQPARPEGLAARPVDNRVAGNLSEEWIGLWPPAP